MRKNRTTLPSAMAVPLPVPLAIAEKTINEIETVTTSEPMAATNERSLTNSESSSPISLARVPRRTQVLSTSSPECEQSNYMSHYMS